MVDHYCKYILNVKRSVQYDWTTKMQNKIKTITLTIFLNKLWKYFKFTNPMVVAR